MHVCILVFLFNCIVFCIHAIQFCWLITLNINLLSSVDLRCILTPSNPQWPENWPWQACLFINRVGICMIRPTEEQFERERENILLLTTNWFLFDWYNWGKSPSIVEGRRSGQTKTSSSLSPFLYKTNSKTGITWSYQLLSTWNQCHWHCTPHVRQNGRQLRLLRINERRRSTSTLRIKWVLLYTRTILYQKITY